MTAAEPPQAQVGQQYLRSCRLGSGPSIAPASVESGRQKPWPVYVGSKMIDNPYRTPQAKGSAAASTRSFTCPVSLRTVVLCLLLTVMVVTMVIHEMHVVGDPVTAAIPKLRGVAAAMAPGGKATSKVAKIVDAPKKRIKDTGVKVTKTEEVREGRGGKEESGGGGGKRGASPATMQQTQRHIKISLPPPYDAALRNSLITDASLLPREDSAHLVHGAHEQALHDKMTPELPAIAAAADHEAAAESLEVIVSSSTVPPPTDAALKPLEPPFLATAAATSPHVSPIVEPVVPMVPIVVAAAPVDVSVVPLVAPVSTLAVAPVESIEPMSPPLGSGSVVPVGLSPPGVPAASATQPSLPAGGSQAAPIPGTNSPDPVVPSVSISAPPPETPPAAAVVLAVPPATTPEVLPKVLPEVLPIVGANTAVVAVPPLATAAPEPTKAAELPPAVSSAVQQSITQAEAKPPMSAAGTTKTNKCDGSMDPFGSLPVDTFLPPKGAPARLKKEWEDAQRAMMQGIRGLSYGGDKLRTYIDGEARKMQQKRLSMFCQYVE